jgi:hypothetical protein
MDLDTFTNSLTIPKADGNLKGTDIFDATIPNRSVIYAAHVEKAAAAAI